MSRNKNVRTDKNQQGYICSYLKICFHVQDNEFNINTNYKTISIIQTAILNKIVIPWLICNYQCFIITLPLKSYSVKDNLN